MITSASLSTSTRIESAIFTPFTNGCFSNAEPVNAFLSQSQICEVPCRSRLSHPSKAKAPIFWTPKRLMVSLFPRQNVFNRIFSPAFCIRYSPERKLELFEITFLTFGNIRFGITISSTCSPIFSSVTSGKHGGFRIRIPQTISMPCPPVFV